MERKSWAGAVGEADDDAGVEWKVGQRMNFL